ncbi:cobalamin B12-binding domain-containing protein [uncultured Rhodoblastus sp.]|uniref:cobalamin B12-binding domain-containing protein n=1 Tax=uncultured Rhodoblastus sp. TaxID=543037 RepID=UPI0025CCE73B|nr:cobalamin B12-binding domain-containing protein [uncultured Rhodoblastus sp.]
MAGHFQTDSCDGFYGFEIETTRLREGGKGASDPQREFVDRRTLAGDDQLEPLSSIAALVGTQIIPQLALLHLEVPAESGAVVAPFGAEDISSFTQLVLAPDTSCAERQVAEFTARGLSMEQVFLDLFEPVARRLGQMWETDECDFMDVTRGMGCLQRLLARMDCNSGAPALIEQRSILMSTMPGEKQHSFGITIVEKMLEAWGWNVRSERPTSIDHILEIVEKEWFAVLGLSVSNTNALEPLARFISEIRGRSQNSSIGVMVGGPALYDQPGLAATVGADATARNASLAVLAAEKLFNLEARRHGSIRR